jgi:hypothetical protein
VRPDVVQTESSEVVDRRAETHGLDDRRGAGLELVREVGVRRPLHRHGRDHLTAAQERRQLLQHGPAAPEDPDARRTGDLVPGEHQEVHTGVLHVDRHLRHGLRGVHEHQRTHLVRTAGDLRDRVDGAEHVRDPGQRDHLGALVDQLVDVRQVELAVVGEAEPPQRRTGALGEELPRHDVRVVLHLGDQHLVALAHAERPAGPGERVGDQVDRLGGVLGEDHLVARRCVEQPGDLVPAALEAGRRLGAQLVHGARDVGVVPLEVVDHRVDDDLRLLGRVGAVEVDQRVPVGHRAAQDREVRADHVEAVEQPRQ